MKPSSSSFDCVRATSGVSGTVLGNSLTSIRCADVYNGEYPTMVSCGFRSNDFNEQWVAGAYSDDGITCQAINADFGSGVYAEARYTFPILIKL